MTNKLLSLVSALLFLPLVLCAQEVDKHRIANSILVQAVDNIDKGKASEAMELLVSAEKLDPENGAIHYYMATILDRAGAPGKAFQHYRKAYAADTTNTWYAMRLADLLCRMGQGKEALDILEGLPSDKGSNSTVMSMKMEAFMLVNDFEKADSLYSRLHAMGGDTDYMRLSHLEITRQKGDYPAFFEGMKDYIRNGESDMKFKAGLVEKVMKAFDPRFNYYHLSDYVDIADEFVSIAPADTNATHLAASIYYNAEMKHKVVELSDANPGDVLLHEYAYVVLAQQDNYKEALQHAACMLGLSDGEGESYLRALRFIASAHHQLGNMDKTYKAYEEILAICPDDVETLNNYAYFMSLEGKKLGKCAKMSKKALEKEPENASYLDTYAWILYKQKKYNAAKSYFKKAMIYGGKESPEVLNHYAACLEALGEDVLAKAYRQQAKMKENEKK